MTLNQLSNNGEMLRDQEVKFKSARSGKIFTIVQVTAKGKFLVLNEEGEELLLKGDEDRYLDVEPARVKELKLALAALDNQAEGLVRQIDTLEEQREAIEAELATFNIN